ncbi:MAG: type II secretion system F family protein [Pseudomonadota bacterium]
MEYLNQINEFLIAQFGELGPLYAVGVLGVLLVSLTLPILLKKPSDPLDKLKGAAPKRQFTKDGEEKKALRHDSGKTDKLDRFANFLEPQDEEEYSSARLMMLQAGYRNKSAVRTFHFAQFALAISFLLIGVLYSIISSATGEVTTSQLVLTILVPGLVGYYIPKYWVNRRLKTRQTEITNGFPDALDMMLVCVEAGQSLEQSILRVSAELRAGFPALADEYEIVSHEMKAGKDKVQVLKDLAERAGVPDVASFVTVLIQSASFGTSIADALRVYASEMRDKRVMRAEEKANVLPTKLTLGTMMFTVPPLLIILLGPSVYQIVVTLQGASF